MNYIIYISIIILIAIFYYFLFKNNKKNIKTKEQKQDEIIKQYKSQMIDLCKKYEQNSSKLRLQKIKLLKKISRELEFNIFFTQDEIRKIIEDLVQEK